MDLKQLQRNLMPLEVANEVSESLGKLLTILTANNMTMIVHEAKLLKISTVECLAKCVDVIYEHAIINESQELFAVLCTKLLFQSVRVSPESQKMKTFKEQILQKAKVEVRNFLERQTISTSDQSDGEGECHKTTACMKKLRRPIAFFRFIGELYLLDFIPATFIAQCVPAMLDEAFCNESSLETFCALLKISGKKFEITEKNDLSDAFEILEKRKTSDLISPHTRFMIEELFEMRKVQWEPVNEVDWIKIYNLFLCDVEEKLYVMELWYGK